MKKPIRIGFDFDKVFVNYPQFVPDRVIDRLYKKKNGVLKYRFPGTVEQQIRILSHHHAFRTPITPNINVLKQICNNGIDTYLISSRFGFLEQRTEQWLARHNLKPYFKGIYFNYSNQQPHEFKNIVLQQLGITHYIDDDLDLLQHLAPKNPNIHFYWMTSRKLKHHPLPNNISIIRTLDDIPSTLYS